MATLQEEFWVDFLDCTGGRNDSLPPHEIAMNECVDAVNITWNQTRFAQKRNGMSTPTLTAVPFSYSLTAMFRHVPSFLETEAELWAFDYSGILGRLAGGTAWATITVPDPVAQARDVDWASFNGKLFITYQGTVNRLKVWDGTTCRLVGFTTTSVAPTVTNTGAGAYPAVVRYYKTAFTQVSGADTIRRSELSAATTFTPSGAGTHARIAKPLGISEGETHWEVWASADNANFYRIASTVVATAQYDDNATPSTYPTLGPLAPAAGENIPPESWKFITVDGNRLLGAGTWATSAAKHNRVWFTPVLGSSDVGDDERVPNTTTQKNWIDVNEKDGDAIMGIRAFEGVVYVFKRRHIYRLIPTGNVAAPYVVEVVSRGASVGCLSQKTIHTGEADDGTPALYFCGEKGLFRVNSNGVIYCGRYMEGLWANVNVDPFDYVGVYPSLQLFGVWYQAKAQYWLFAAVRGEPFGVHTIGIFHAKWGRMSPEGVIGGWSRYTFQNQDLQTSPQDGNLILSAVMFSGTIGTRMSFDLKPYIAYGNAFSASTGGEGKIHKADDAAATTDVGVNFGGHIRLPEKAFAGYGRRFSVRKAFVVGKIAASTTLQIKYTIDFGLATRTATWVLVKEDASTSQERRIWYVEDAEAADCGTVEIRIGDAAAAATGSWQLEGARFLMQAQQVV